MQIQCPQCGKMLEAPWPLPERAQCPFCNAVFSPAPLVPRPVAEPPPIPPSQAVWPSGPPASPFLTPTIAAQAAEQVRTPAIGLVITGALSLIYSIFDLGARVLMLMGFQIAPQPANLPPFLQMLAQPTPGQLITGGVLDCVSFVTCLLVIYGALKMQRLESYAWAMTSSIISLIPCVTCCCCLGIPFGVWALIVLNRAEIRAAFR